MRVNVFHSLSFNWLRNWFVNYRNLISFILDVDTQEVLSPCVVCLFWNNAFVYPVDLERYRTLVHIKVNCHDLTGKDLLVGILFVVFSVFSRHSIFAVQPARECVISIVLSIFFECFSDAYTNAAPFVNILTKLYRNLRPPRRKWLTWLHRVIAVTLLPGVNGSFSILWDRNVGAFIYCIKF